MFNYFLNLIKSNNLIKNSSIFFAGSLVVNLGNYLFNLLMARMLGVVEYGELQSLLATFVIIGIPLAVVYTLIIKYSAHFKGAGQWEKIYGLFHYFTRKLLLAGILIFLLVIFLSGYLSRFLQLSSIWPIFILGFSIITSFILLTNRAILQGTQKFKELSVNSGIEVFFKIIFAVVLIFMGWRLNGAVSGIVLGAAIAYGFSFLPIKFIFRHKTKEININTKEIFNYSLPVFLTLLSLTLFYTIDVILVKHFLSPELAGQYSGLSLLGRTLFFLSGPIIAVMFSMSSEASVRSGKGGAMILKESFILVGILSLAVLAAYFIFPGLIIRILLGSGFLKIAPYVGWFTLAMVFYTFINLLAQYFLSRHRSKFAYILLAGVLAQVILISLWHQNLVQIVWIMNIVLALVLFSFLMYYFKTRKPAELHP